jgi:hypothetical protein
MPTAAEALSGGAGAPNSGAPSSSGNVGAVPPGAGGQPTPQGFWSDWKAPEQKDIREWAANKNYSDTFALAKTARELEQQMGTLKAARPGYPTPELTADGKPTPAYEAARKAWNMTAGVPETADKYDIPVPAENPYPQFKTYMAQALHEVGVPGAMATELTKAYNAAVGKMEAEIRTQEDRTSQEKMLELERAWGSNYQERVAFAGRGKQWLSNEVGGLNDMQLRTLEAVLGTDKFMTAMWKIGAGNKEASFAGGSHAEGGKFANTASAAQERFNQIQRDRTQGKITDFEWRELAKKGGEIDGLMDTIAKGMAPMN